MEFLATLTVMQVLSGGIGIVICAFSIAGWCSLIMRGFQETPEEKARLEQVKAEYFKRYNVMPPGTYIRNHK